MELKYSEFLKKGGCILKNRSILNNMLKVIVGQSEDVDSLDAITEIIESCNEQASDEIPKAGILFCAVDFEYEIILDEINKAYPNIELIGCTTDGEMSSAEGFLEDSITLTLFYTDSIEIKASIGRTLSEGVRKSVSSAIADVKDKLSEKAKFCIVTPESLTVNNVEVLESIKDEFSTNFPIFGGLAGDQWQMKETFQFFKTDVLSDSLPILVFAGPVYFSSGLANGWNPIGNKKKVTKVENNVVYELDNQPILEFYNHYLGSYSKISSEYALAVFPENEKEFYLRSPAASDPETKSIAFFGDIPENATVQLTECTSTDIVNASQTAIESAISNYDNDKPPATALVFSCATRKQLLGINTYKEMDLLRHFLPDSCSINGFYTYGEIAPMSRNNESRFHNSTILTVLIGEE